MPKITGIQFVERFKIKAILCDFVEAMLLIICANLLDESFNILYVMQLFSSSTAFFAG